MAKDVDLSSQGWTDLIFEGKNKEFGAYQLRRNSASRHNKSMIIVMIVLSLVFSVIFFWADLEKLMSEEEDTTASVEHEEISMLPTDLEAPDEDIPLPDDFLPPPSPEETILEENVAAEQMVTELKLVTEVDSTKAIQDVSDVQDNKAAVGTQNVEGSLGALQERVEEQIIVKEEPKEEKPKVEQVFTVVEQPASYPGGEAELLKWISQNIQYPPMAAEEGAQGRVVVQFVVEKDGRVGHVNVVRGRHPELDKEAIRVVKSIKTRFVPGKNNGQPVRQWFTLPINFKLQQ